MYETQAHLRGPQGRPPDPLTGSHYEVGVKWGEGADWLATAALFRLEQTGYPRLLENPSDDPLCCYDNSFDQRSISEGAELGFSGTPGGQVQLSANYVYSRNAVRGSDAVRAGERLSAETPRHLLQLWARWRPTAERWQPLTLGGGIYAQSESSWRRQIAFTPDGPRIVAVPQGGYMLASLHVGWQFDAHWHAQVNVDNLFDREYDISRRDVEGGDLYGMPRRLQFTLRAAF